MNLLDVNVWLAIAFASKKEHAVADAWFQSQPPRSCCFCRMTQQGFLRLATNPSMAGSDVKTMWEAWQLYDQLLADPRVSFSHEPKLIDSAWRIFTQFRSYSHKVWNDAFLAAFAVQAGFELVSFDKGFRQFQRLSCTIL